jgi:hypothetical protein
MTQANTLIVAAAAIALSFGVTGQGKVPIERQVPLSNSDIVIVKDEAARVIGQPEDAAHESAEMGKADGTQNGEHQGDAPQSQSAKMNGSQPDEGQAE